MPNIITNEVDGFISDDDDKLIFYINLLLTDDLVADKISKNSIKIAKKLFSKETVINNWKDMFNDLGLGMGVTR